MNQHKQPACTVLSLDTYITLLNTRSIQKNSAKQNCCKFQAIRATLNFLWQQNGQSVWQKLHTRMTKLNTGQPHASKSW